MRSYVKLFGLTRIFGNKAAFYQEWIEKFDKLTEEDVELISSHIGRFSDRPRISVIVIPGAGSVRKTLASLAQQLYREFEIFTATHDRPQLGLDDIGVKVIGRQESEADFFNAALAFASGEFCLAVDAGDLLSRNGLYLYANAANQNPTVDLIYGDEDELIFSDLRVRPFFKPSWNPQLALAFDYVGATALCRTDRLRVFNGASAAAGAAWRWHLLLRLMEGSETQGKARRIPHIVLHRRRRSPRARRAELTAGKIAVTNVLWRQKLPALVKVDWRGWLSVAPLPPAAPVRVSIIVATRDRVDLLRKCVDGILNRTTYPRFDLTIVDNLSKGKETLAYLQTLKNEARVSVVPYTGPFSFARLHNVVVPRTYGDLIVFLNNDVEVIHGDWLERMVGFAIQPDIGIAGAKLYYPNNTIQHAGVAINFGYERPAIHAFRKHRRRDRGARGFLMVSRDVSAVTGACMMLRRSVFDECGGFDEALSIDFNDIDLCLRVGRRGYRVVLVADAELYHHESATRGVSPRTAERWKLQQHEIDIFSERWRSIGDDPQFNPNLGRNTEQGGLSFPPRASRPWREQQEDKSENTYHSAAAAPMPTGATTRSRQLNRGVALYGFFRAEIGLGQGARGMAEAFRTTAIPFSCHLVPLAIPFANPVAYPCSSDVHSHYDRALLIFNAPELLAMQTEGALPLSGKHRIGYWAWELPVFPAIWARAFDMVDEIWVPSRFVATALACATTKPVKIVPHVVAGANLDKKAARELYNIPQEAFVFLNVFDVSSYVARKNPEAAVRAFLDAFPQHDAHGPILVVKCHHQRSTAAEIETLAQLVRGQERIILIDRVFSSSEMAALTCAADAFISLHRSEGFGLNIAEAMASGRLAIATNFSGNTDFMHKGNSLPIPFRMRAVEPFEYLYGTGQWWAEPDHDAAVAALRMAVSDRAMTAQLAERGRRDMETDFSAAAVGRIIASALT